MPARKGLLAPQNTFLDTIATRFDGTHSNFVLGNAKIAINPIVYCSDGFCDLTGYSRAHIMQKSCACNFLYGPRTDFRHKEAISRALEQKQELKLEVILYKRSGGGGTQAATDSRTPFWCLLDIVPIQDEKHEVVLFLCSHKDITKQKWHEEKEHELARLKQLKLASNATSQLHAAAATAADQHPASGEPPAATGKQRGSDQQECASLVSPSAFPAAPATTCPDQQLQLQQHHNQPNDFVQQQQQQSKLDDADDAELTALANQNALISMDEFRLDNFDDDEHEFDDDDDDEDHDKHTANQYSRRRSRAVLYQLSGHYGNRRSVNMKSKLKLNNRMNIPEYKTTTIEKQKFILSHYGIGKTCWDWLILVVSFYVAIVVPYNATFNNKQQDLLGGGKIDSIDIIVEVVFIIDVILNFRTTFVNRKGEVVTRPKIICRHYLRGWFMVDACAAVPFDLLCGLNIYDRSILKVDLNLLKLIRLLRLARLLQKMDRYSQYSYIILTLLILIFSLLAHWCACIWYVIAMKEISAHPDWKIGWIHQLSDKLGYSVINATDLASSYVTALYFTTSSLTSVGFGNVSANTNAEKIFSIVIMLIGALMHAVVFGNVTALIRVMYARRSNYQTRLRDLKDFFRLHQLPKELQQRMSDYFQTTWSLNHGIETSEILRDFPEELRGDVSLHLHHEVLSLPIFETAPQGFLKSLAKHIESKFCCPTEYLIHRRDALNYLYLVCNGSMEVLQDNMVVAILGKGDLVGYDVSAQITADLSGGGNAGGTGGASGIGGGSVALVGGGGAKLGGGCQAPGGGGGLVKSSSDLKALTYCDLKCIHISGLLETLKLYPEFSDTFHREIVHDLSFNLRESHETTDNETTDDDDDEDADGDEDDEDDGDGGPHTLASPSSLLDGGGGDGDDEQGDGYTNGNGRKARGGRSPPPSIGHLYRSITGSGENQIGRYDHDDEDHGEANENERVRDELVEEDEDVDEDDDEEEDDDDEQDDDDEEEGHEGHDGDDNDHNGCSGGGGGSSTDGGAGAGGAAGSSEERRANGRALQSASSDESSGGNGASQTAGGIQQAAGGSGWNGVRVAKRNVADVDDNVSGDASKPVLRRRLTSGNIGAVPVDPAAAARRRRPRRRRSFCQENAEEDEDATDWQSARSCDGLASADAVVTAGGRPAAAADDSVLLVLAKEKRAADVSGAAAVAPLTLRSAIGGGPKLGSRSVKPPLSFDLSRNTTAIVDRRRRSAGCIPRPLLQGLAAANSSPAGTNSAATRRAKHSSLNHINEEPQVSRDQQQQPLATKRSSQRRANGQAASTRYHQPAVGKLTCSPSSTSCDNGATPTPPTSLDASAALDRRHLNELRSIDTRINGLEASVWDMRRELKRELRSELHQIRASIEQQLMQLVSDTVSWRQQASGNRRAGQTSAANVSTTSNSNFKTSRQQQQQRQNSFQSATCSSRPSAGSISQSNTDVRERTTISSSVVPQTSFSSSVAAATTITGRNDASAGHHQSASFGILPTNATTGRQVIGTSCSGGNQPLATPTKVRPLKKSQSSASFIKASGKLSISSDEHRALVWGELADSLSSCAKSDSVTASTSSIVVSLPAASSHVARVCNNASYGTTTSVITASATTSHQDLALGNAKSPATNSFLVNSNNTSNDSKHTTPLPMASGYLQHQFQDCTSLMRQSSSGATLNNTSDNDSGRSSSSTSMNIAGHLRNGHTVVAPASALITRSYPDWMQQQQQAIVHVSPDLCDTSPLGGRSAKMLLTTANCNNNNGEDGSCNDAQYTIDLDPVIGPKLPTPTGASSATGGSNIL